MKSVRERKTAERERMKRKGLKRFEAWVHPVDRPAVRTYIARKNRLR